jgi:competence protein ComFC
MFNFIKDIIAPKKCYSCKKEWHFLCPTCLSSMSNFTPICYICKGKSDNFIIHNECQEWIYYDQLIVLTHYKNKHIAQLIKHAKFYGKKDILEDIWTYLWKVLLSYYKVTEKDIILWVPMSFWKKLRRWYNQSHFIAKKVSKICFAQYRKDILKKKKSTRQQSKLSRQQREENLKDCFQINKKKVDIIDKKNIIIVDDVVSTWATLNEIAKQLKLNWANKVIWLCFASD